MKFGYWLEEVPSVDVVELSETEVDSVMIDDRGKQSEHLSKMKNVEQSLSLQVSSVAQPHCLKAMECSSTETDIKIFEKQ